MEKLFPMTELDVICFSHLRWDFVYQRPQHLMSRFAKDGRVFFIEEPVYDVDRPRLEILERGENIFVCVPHFPPGLDPAFVSPAMQNFLAQLIQEHEIEHHINWFYTPMMLGWSVKLRHDAVIYDCMDELSNFKNAPPELVQLECELFSIADLVFTGGRSLYEAKRNQHPNVFAFPSSIDREHFGTARTLRADALKSSDDRKPTIGFVGVIDERLDIELLDSIAKLRPTWKFVMVGPVVKIEENDLPRRANIQYLGQSPYDELPSILARWDVAMMPFAMNESTRFISPTKTPEYLAAGLPVVSTPIRDVIRPYGELGIVHIAETPAEFVQAVDRAFNEDREKRLQKADEYLADLSWDKTYRSMKALIEGIIDEKREPELRAKVSV